MFTTNDCIVVIGIAFVVTSCATPGQGAPSVASASDSVSASESASASEHRLSSFWARVLEELFQLERLPATPSIIIEPPAPVAAPSTPLGKQFELERLPAVPSLKLEPPPPPPPPATAATPPEENKPTIDQRTVDQAADSDDGYTYHDIAVELTEQSTDQTTEQSTDQSIDQTTEQSTEQDSPLVFCNVICYRFTKEGKLIMIKDEVPDGVMYEDKDDWTYDAIDEEGDAVPEQATNQVTGQVIDGVTGQVAEQDKDQNTDPVTNQIIDEVQDQISAQDDVGYHSYMGKEFADPRPTYPEKSQFEKQRLFQKWNKYPKKFYGSKYESDDKDLAQIFAKDSLHWRLRRSAESSADDTYTGEYGSYSKASSGAGYVEPNSQDIYESESYDSLPLFPIDYVPEVRYTYSMPELPARFGGSDQGSVPGIGLGASIAGPAKGSYSMSSSSDDGNGNRNLEVHAGLLN